MLEPGDVVDGRFEVEALLGEGGLAAVYRVRHVALGSVHALKLLSWRKRTLAERLLLEGRIQAQLQHPNIVAVTDLVRHDGQFGLLMEYVDSLSLEEFLTERGGLGVDEGLRLFAPILAGVAAAHDAGVTHRDLKPANILLASTPRGLVPKITDFGIAKVMAELGEGSTAVGATMGTPGYLAPEQIEDSSSTDERADLFALGAIAWELITGRRAFADERGELTVFATSRRPTPSLAPLVDDVPVHVDEALTRAMAKRPEERFESCAAFAAVLFADRPELLAEVQAVRPGGRAGTELALEGIRGTIAASLATPATMPELPVRVSPSTASETLLPDLEPETLGQGPPPAPVAAPARTPAAAPSTRWGPTLVLFGALAGVALLWAAPWAAEVPTPTPERAVPAPPSAPPPPAATRSQPVDGPLPEPDGHPTPPVGEGGDAAASPSPTASEGPDGTQPTPAAEPAPRKPDVAPTAAPTPGSTGAATVSGRDPSVSVDEAEPQLVGERPRQPGLHEREASDASDDGVAVAAAEPPPPVPATPAAPAVAGRWAGRANGRPLELVLGVERGVVSGRAVFALPTRREEALRGTIAADGALSFEAGELRFEGTAAAGEMSGTYRAAGSSRALQWSVSRAGD